MWLRPLASSRKRLLDTVKMVAYRAETAMVGIVRESLRRSDDGRSLIQDLFRQDADLLLDESQGRLEVRVHPLPVELVECIFLGQAPALVPEPRGANRSRGVETSALILRLAESATDWQAGKVNELLGHWREGYIMIRGTWCEPISRDPVQQLNDRLAAAHRRQREQLGA